MSEEGKAPQMDAAALQAQIARAQKVFGFLFWIQLLLCIAFLVSPAWLAAVGLKLSPTEPYAYVGWSPFLLALAIGANAAKNNLAFAKVVLQGTAVGELGLALITLIAMFVFHLPVLFWVLVVLTAILGLIPINAIAKFKKATGA